MARAAAGLLPAGLPGRVVVVAGHGRPVCPSRTIRIHSGTLWSADVEQKW